jgi:hypothetical protein
MTAKVTSFIAFSAQRFHRMFRMDERHVEWMLPFGTAAVCQRPAARAVRGAHQGASAPADPAQSFADRSIRVPLISASCSAT